MQPTSHNSQSGAGRATAPAFDELGRCLEGASEPDRFCQELSKMFQVLLTEVALFRAEEGQLKFLFPLELRTAGSIPFSSSAVAAHTAVSGKAELYNNFYKIKHASIFEHVKLRHKDEGASTEKPIQKLMSAPVMDAKGQILGVVQVCRKGYDSISAGSDFTLEQLRRLERAAHLAARAPFMKVCPTPPAK